MDQSRIPEIPGDLTPLWVRKAPPWVASVALHAVLVLVAMATIFHEEAPKARAQLVRMRQRPVKEFEKPQLPPDTANRPEVDLPEFDVPVEELEKEEQEVKEPKGNPLARANKETERNQNYDGLGPAGGGSRKYGFRHARDEGYHVSGGPGGYKVPIERGFGWLVRHQSPDGSWKAARFEEVCEEGGCGGPGFDGYDVGVTSLAVLAFAGTGNTPWHGRYRKTVKGAVDWLLKQQGPDGAIGRSKAEGWMYNHAIATMALCEIRALAGPHAFRLRPATESAVAFCLRAQNPGNGWRYEARSGDNDTSITGWMVLALKAARVARMRVPDESFQSARAFIDRATAQNGATGYRSPDGASSYLKVQLGKFDPVPTMTAVGVLCRRLTGQPGTERVVKDGVEVLLADLPSTDARKQNHYYWYYGTYAMFQSSRGPSDRRWKQWNRAVQEAIVATQVVDGGRERHGSWSPTGEWGIAGGRVYSTAINLLTLEASFRYERVK